MRRALLWSLAVGIATATFAPTAAMAATPAPTPEPGESTIVYEVVKNQVTVDSDGGKHNSDPESSTMTVACSQTSCRFLPGDETFYLGQLTWVPGTATSEMHIDGNTTSCQSDKGLDGDVSLEITAASFTGVFRAPSPGWDDCDGTQTYRWAMRLTYTGTYVSGETCILDAGGCPTPTPTPTPEATIIAEAPVDAEPAVEDVSFLDTGSPAAPSVLSTLATPATAGTAPSQLLLAAALTVVLVLLVAFPTSLLNSAVEAGSGRLADWWSGRRGRVLTMGAVAEADVVPAEPSASAPAEPETPRASAAPWHRTWWWAAAGIAAASVISAFVDPEFGFNAGSARVVLSLLVGFAIDVALGWLVVIWLVRRFNPGVAHAYAFQPLTLVVVVAAVLFTRVTGFEPGIVFGLVAGVAFGVMAGRAQEARAALITLGYAFGVALVAWVVYGAIGGGAAAGGSFWGTFAVETLSSIAIGGMAALPIALFPLRGLAGHSVWMWNRAAWFACYAIGLFAFFIVLMPMPFSWEGVGWDLWAWIAVYLAYAVFAVVSWLLLARPWRKGEASQDLEAPVDAAGVVAVGVEVLGEGSTAAEATGEEQPGPR